MSFSTQPVSEDTLIITIGDTLNFRNAGAFKAALQAPIENGKRQFILDFSETEVLDSSGLGALLSLYRRAAARGGSVAFANASDPVRVVVDLTRTYKIFPQYDAVADARADLT